MPQRDVAVTSDGKFAAQQASLMVEQTIRAARETFKLREAITKRGFVKQFDLLPIAFWEPLIHA